MRILTDHCVHGDVVAALRTAGHDVERALDAGLAAAEDDIIFERACATRRILLSFDGDFGNIVRFNIRASRGVVVCHPHRMSRTAIVDAITGLFLRHSAAKMKGRLFVVEARGLRIWPREHD